jgi:hypothetical protein
MRRSNSRLIAKPLSLLINNSIQITISSETVNITPVIIIEAETVITTRIPISPITIVIAIRILRSYTLYIRNYTATPRSIY